MERSVVIFYILFMFYIFYINNLIYTKSQNSAKCPSEFQIDQLSGLQINVCRIKEHILDAFLNKLCEFDLIVNKN